MSWNYNGLWKLLIDKGMTKSELREKVKMGPVTLAKLSKCEPVSMDVLERICRELDCDISDIVKYIHD